MPVYQQAARVRNGRRRSGGHLAGLRSAPHALEISGAATDGPWVVGVPTCAV